MFYIKTLPCTYMFVQSLQGGTECSVGLRVCTIQIGLCVVYVCMFRLHRDQKQEPVL